MNEFGLTFHHFGLAVQAPDTAFRYLAALGYRNGPPVFDPLQRVNLAMSWHDAMPDVEVIWPGDEPSPIDKMVKRNGTLIYHLCYIAPDPDASLAAMAAAGFESLPVCPAQPAILFDGREVSFHHVLDFGLIELIHGDMEPGRP